MHNHYLYFPGREKWPLGSLFERAAGWLRRNRLLIVLLLLGVTGPSFGQAGTCSDITGTGTVIGTAGSYGSYGATRDKAFDGNTDTFFDAPTASGAWVGLDLGTAQQVCLVRFYPRSGWNNRMVGGKFQGSNTPDFSSGVIELHTIATAPAYDWNEQLISVTNQCRYVRYLSPNESYGNIAEMAVSGGPLVGSDPNNDTYAPSTPRNPKAVIAAESIKLSWTASTDNVGVTGYRVYAGTTLLGTPAGPAFTVSNLAPGTTYSYAVTALDAAGNESARSVITQKTLPAGTFAVSGTKILGPGGQEFVIKGVNVNGPGWVWPREITQDASLIANWAFNLVRVNCVIGVTPTSNADLNKIINEFTSRGIVVMLEAHDKTGGYFTSTSSPSLTDLTNWHAGLARTYKDNPYVWFNVMNEPGTNALDPQWLPMHQHVTAAIRAEGATNLIVADGSTWGQDTGYSQDGDVQPAESAVLSYGPQLLEADPTGNTVFSIHMYAGWDHATNKLANYVQAVHARNLCLIIGEYGTTKDFKFLTATRKTLQYAIPNKIGRVVWAWDGGDDWELTTTSWAGGGGWGSNTDGTTKPTNLTWFGEKVWNDNHNLPVTLDDIDLSVADIALSKAIFAAGDQIQFKAQLKNTGDVATTGKVRVRFLVNGVEVSTGEFTGDLKLTASGSAVSGLYTVPANLTAFSLEAVIDLAGSTYGTDVNAANNAKTIPVNGAAPASGVDLVITALTALPAAPEQGTETELKVTIRNQGSANSPSTRIGGVFFINGVAVANLGTTTVLNAGATLEFVTRYLPKADFEISFKVESGLGGVDVNATNENVFALFKVKPVPSYNLLVNGGFESGTANWSDWGNRSATTAEAHSGTQSLRIGAGGSGGGGNYLDLEPNTTYILGAWGKHDVTPAGGPSDIGFQYRSTEGAPQQKFVLSFTETAWTYKSVTFTTGPQVLPGDGNVFIWKNNADANFYADDISVSAVPVAQASVLFNGDFELGTQSWSDWGRRTVTEVPAEVFAGTQSLKIGAGGSGGGGNYLDLQPNTTYVLGAWGRNDVAPTGGPSDLGFQYRTTAGAVQEKYILSFTETAWTYKTVTFTTGPTVLPGDGNVFIWKNNANANFYADNVTLVVVSGAGKAGQTIAFGPLAAKTYGDAPFALNATASSGLPVAFSVVSGPATVASNTLTLTGAGTVVVRASQEGDQAYEAATPVDQTFTVAKAGQTIAFAAISPKTTTQTVTLSATASSGLTVSFAVVSGPGIISGNTLSFTRQGKVVVQATQAGNANYAAAAPVSQTVVVENGKKNGIQMTIYPNPTRGQLVIRLEDKQDREYTFAVYNSQAAPVITAIIPEGKKTDAAYLDLRNRPDGYYYVHVSDGDQTTVVRIQKQ
jgi:hypothetical protein